MRVEIRKLQRRLSTTSIYVTHDQLEAMTLADILVVMNGGQVEQIGNPLNIYQKPATTFVASFIGAPPMNLMPLRSDEIKSQLNGDARINEAGILGIRPEDFVITNETVSGGVALGLTVEAIERVGAETFIYGTRQQEVQGVAATPGELPPGEVIVRIPGAIGPAIGERLRAASCIYLPPTAASGWVDEPSFRGGAERRTRNLEVPGSLRAPERQLRKPAAADLRCSQRCLNRSQITPIFPGDRTASRPAG